MTSVYCRINPCKFLTSSSQTWCYIRKCIRMKYTGSRKQKLHTWIWRGRGTWYLKRKKMWSCINKNEPRHEKTCLRGLRPGKTQTGLLSNSDQLSWNFGYSKNRYYIIQAANYIGADQTARCSVWSAPLLLAYGINKLSHDVAQIKPTVITL